MPPQRILFDDNFIAPKEERLMLIVIEKRSIDFIGRRNWSPQRLDFPASLREWSAKVRLRWGIALKPFE